MSNIRDALLCNKPKAQTQGGKSHVVKACSGGKEKVIRFGQAGVQGSPKGSSRNEAFHARHAKNIAKGPMSAAWWASKVKWLILLSVFAAGCSESLATIPRENRPGLGAAAAFAIVTHVQAVTPATPVSPSNSDVCDECQGLGKVGDGTVMLTCSACGGTGKRTSVKLSEVSCQATDVDVVPDTEDNPPAPGRVIAMPGPQWNFSGMSNPSDAYKRSHLLMEHGVDATGWTSQEMTNAHSNLHNGHPALGSLSGKGSSSTSSQGGDCPGGCPTSAAPSGTKTGTTRSRLFGRWR